MLVTFGNKKLKTLYWIVECDLQERFYHFIFKKKIRQDIACVYLSLIFLEKEKRCLSWST